ncbi:MAG: nucleotidyltransferase family protein [Anaerolineae bacterium]
MSVTISQEEARRVAEQCAELLRQRFGATRVVLFGSAAGDAPWHGRSDLDLAVEGLRPEDHVPALTACYELLPRGVELDLVPLESAWPELRARILGEVEMPGDPLQALRLEIEAEVRNLERIADRARENTATVVVEPSEVEVQGIAKYVHDFYNGVERIFERIAVRLDGDLPAGPSWHTLLLQRMGQPFPGVRPAVIDRALEVELAEYLRFRHLFRHTYGYDLEWKRVQELSRALPDVLEPLDEQLTAFLEILEAQTQKLPDDDQSQ